MSPPPLHQPTWRRLALAHRRALWQLAQRVAATP